MSLQQLESLIQKLKAVPVDPTASFARRRGAMEKAAFRLDADIKAEPVTANGVPAEWITAPNADTGRNVLYLHGGGYTIGSIKTHRCLAGWVSRAAQARVLIIDYRLAPEHPFPAAVEDSVAAYRFMLDSGVKPSRAAVAGDSAGGGLTVAALLALRDAKLPQPAAAVCISPWVDMEGTGESMKTKADVDPMVGSANLADMAAAYLGGKDPKTPLASPLYADLRGLPPMLIQVGTSEVLLDDSKRLAERARAAGVDAIYEPWENMIHVWQIFVPMLDEAKQAVERIGGFIREKTP
ncbi:MAG TPA: alpha/beta hydrolase [Candidatus Binataceae bacterium]|jgi:acetyl esterase/lipase|nr:alpha/beta hydrolase [Candidatus Binataceae bacterium]